MKVDTGNPGSDGMTTEQANEYYGRMRRDEGVAQAQGQQDAARARFTPVERTRSEASQSPECKAALRDYDIESKSIATNNQRLAARRATVSSQCQIDLPDPPKKSKACKVTPGVVIPGGVVAGGVVVCPPE